MAVGDIASGWSSIASGSYLEVQPDAGVEWAIFSFQGEAEFEVYRTNGTNSFLIIPAGVSGIPNVLSNMNFVATNGQYYRLKNTNAASKYLGYDARVTK